MSQFPEPWREFAPEAVQGEAADDKSHDERATTRRKVDGHSHLYQAEDRMQSHLIQ